MKTKFIFTACIIAAFLFGSGRAKENFDYKVKIVPNTNNSVTNLGDVKKAADVINKRLIYFFDIPQENIKIDITEPQIVLTLHNIDTGKVSRIKNVITGNNTLEFWETYENSEIIGYLTKADNLLRAMRSPGSILKEEKQPNPDFKRKSTVKTAVLDSRKQYSDQNPLLSILGPRLTTNGEPLPSSMIGLANEKDTSMVTIYLKMDKIKALFPNDLKFCWDSNPYKYDPSKALYGLHAIKVTTPDRCAPLDGSAIISAEATAGYGKKDVKISLTMDPDGAKTWSRITRENISRCIAVVYNGSVRSYPRVQAEISGGKTEITGDFTIEEANDLVKILKSGQLPFELKIVEEQIIKGE
jgi:SecD/SecF fusion protein